MTQEYKQQFVDPTYLQSEQYKTPANLEARIQLHECFSTNPYPWPRWVLDRLQVPPGSQFLEIGCGRNRHRLRLLSHSFVSRKQIIPSCRGCATGRCKAEDASRQLFEEAQERSCLRRRIADEQIRDDSDRRGTSFDRGSAVRKRHASNGDEWQ